MRHLQKFVASGKPIVAIRTSSHAFSLRAGEPPAGHEAWPEFDRDVLGGNYQGHHGNKSSNDPETFVQVVADARQHPLLHAVRADEFRVASWLYKTSPLGPNTTVLMLGRVEGREPHEPVSWTNITEQGGRVFYTSLGHPADFRLPAFQRLLANAVYWACDRQPSAPIR
jgi:type 1 glutamine amidotransferase